jgi:hypothetical protein
MTNRKLAGCLFGALLALSPLSALAEEPARKDEKPVANGNYAYSFDDDRLLGDMAAASGSVIRVRGGAARVQLMRPRLHFVNELLKSAEGL